MIVKLEDKAIGRINEETCELENSTNEEFSNLYNKLKEKGIVVRVSGPNTDEDVLEDATETVPVDAEHAIELRETLEQMGFELTEE